MTDVTQRALEMSELSRNTAVMSDRNRAGICSQLPVEPILGWAGLDWYCCVTLEKSLNFIGPQRPFSRNSDLLFKPFAESISIQDGLTDHPSGDKKKTSGGLKGGSKERGKRHSSGQATNLPTLVSEMRWAREHLGQEG